MTNKLTGFVILGLTLLVIAVDLLLLLVYGPNGTISWWLWIQSHNWPPLPFAAGVLVGHLFFSQPHIPPTNE